ADALVPGAVTLLRRFRVLWSKYDVNPRSACSNAHGNDVASGKADFDRSFRGGTNESTRALEARGNARRRRRRWRRARALAARRAWPAVDAPAQGHEDDRARRARACRTRRPAVHPPRAIDL